MTKIDIGILQKTAKELVAKGKGILAADESLPTMEKRLSAIGLQSTEKTRREYRELLFTTAEIEKYISGVILFDETIRQSTDEEIPFPKFLAGRGIIPGIKVDKGKIDMPDCPGEKITQGIEGLADRLIEYKRLGARFTKWRTVVVISDETPTQKCLDANSETQARFALVSQEAGLVPIVEPEVLIDGDHDITRSHEVVYMTLNSVFKKLVDHKVELSGMLLKSSMVTPGKDCPDKASPEQVAKETLEVFNEVIPSEVPGIVFLSGGQTPQEATANLNAMNKLGGVPWELSFSFGRALQEPALEAWGGSRDNVSVAQDAFLKRARLNFLARSGDYAEEMEGKNGE